MSEYINAPRVSIGMPVYNEEAYISEAIDSLLSQTFTDFELIISDNCSNDFTENICRDYQHKDHRIRYIRQAKNVGPMRNFRFVLEQAKGEYFMWAAADDRRAPQFLETTTRILDRDQGCDLVFSDYYLRNLETSRDIIRYVSSVNSTSMYKRYISMLLNMNTSIFYGLYRRDALNQVELGNFDFADLHLIISIAISGRIRIVNDFLHVVGTKGIRVPYSLTGRKIERVTFLKNQFALVYQYFGFIKSIPLILLIVLLMVKNKFSLGRTKKK